jgi:hypothetical protein
VRDALAAPECAQALSRWTELLAPYLGPDAWLADDGQLLESLLNTWAPDSRDELVQAAQQGATDGGAGLIEWLDAAYARSLSGAGDYYLEIMPWDAMPGWWTGQDPETGAWMAVQADGRPSAHTTGWVTCASALESQAAESGAVPEPGEGGPAAWYEGEPQSVPGRDGWWAVVDAGGQWWAVASVDAPDARTVGWLRYEDAFAATEAAEAGADELPRSAAGLTDDVVDMGLADLFDEGELETIFDGVDLSQYSPEEIEAAMASALQDVFGEQE